MKCFKAGSYTIYNQNPKIIQFGPKTGLTLCMCPITDFLEHNKSIYYMID